MRKVAITVALIFFAKGLFAQIEHPVKWSYAAKLIGQNQAVVFFKADVEDGWHIYSAFQPDGGPVKTSFEFAPSKDWSLDGHIQEPAPTSKFEQAFNMKVSYFENSSGLSAKGKIKHSAPGREGATQIYGL